MKHLTFVPACKLLLALPMLALGAAPVLAETFVSGDVYGTWTLAGSPYIATGNLAVPQDSTLAIEAGVEVRFRVALQMVVRGDLIALGTLGMPVLFTSDRPSPAPGDWFGIVLVPGSNLTLEYTWFEYGGRNNIPTVRTGVPANSITWTGGGVTNSMGDGVQVSVDSIHVESLEFHSNGGDGIDITPSTVPYISDIVATNNGGRAVVVNGVVGSFQGTFSGSGNGTNGIYVEGSLGGTGAGGLWEWEHNHDFPYVVDSLKVDADDTLRIDSASTVKFWEVGSRLEVAGVLLTLGDSGADGPVWFTSLKDDEHGGDTNGDGGATAPAPGDWMRLELQPGSVAMLNDTYLAYGGSTSGNLFTSGILDLLDWSGGGSLHSQGVGIACSGTNIRLDDLLIEDNAGDGISLYPFVPPELSNIAAIGNGGRAIAINQNPGSFPATINGMGNGTNGIWLSGNLSGTEPGATWTWEANPDFPYVVENVFIQPEDTLEIAGGAVVKFWAESSRLRLRPGAVLRTLGTVNPWNEVSFTSLKDDSRGGDTNDDGWSSYPQAGDWIGIGLEDDCVVSFGNTAMIYGGNGPSAMVFSSGHAASFTYEGGRCIRSDYIGLHLIADDVSISKVWIANSNSDGVRIYPFVSAVIESCDFNYHDDLAVNHDMPNPIFDVDASNCYWGHPSGPYDPTDGNPDYNPGGLGEGVSDYVIYRPWLASPAVNTPPPPVSLEWPTGGELVHADSALFEWTSVEDPEGGPVTYKIQVDSSWSFTSPVIDVSGLTDTTYVALGELRPLTTYFWRVFAEDSLGAWRVSARAMFHTDDRYAGVALPEEQPKFDVGYAAPSPMLTTSSLRLSIPTPQRVKVDVLDIRGRLTRRLADEILPAGTHGVTWDGRNESGRKVASGIYFLRVSAASGTRVRRVVLLR